MKILFIGVGLTDYTNQILNKLNKEADIELYNLVDSGGKGHVGDAVHQTNDGINFNVVKLKQQIFNIFSDYRYKGFKNFRETVENIKPEIIVITEVYLPFIINSRKNRNLIKKMGIKLVMKDIPFRLDKYQDTKNKIIRGELDDSYTPFYYSILEIVSKKTKSSNILLLTTSFLRRLNISPLYKKIIGRKILLKKLEQKKHLLNFVDAHVDYVEEAYEIFGSYGVSKEKIFIMYNSPDTDYLFEIRKEIEKEKPKLPENKHRLIHIGRLIEWKNVDMLIRSVKDISNKYNDIELLIIGNGPEEQKLRKLTSELNLEKSVIFLGGLYNPREIGRYLLSSTIYVLAGMGGISINDAMVFGKPIICSICDGTEKKLVYNDFNGLYFKDGNKDDLTKKILMILDDENKIRTMGENSTSIIKDKINIHTVISGYKNAFNYVLKTK
jgi:glycosyltransferase involved in cell wall biosynthesis